MKLLSLVLIFLCAGESAFSQEKIALIYKGPGSCEPSSITSGCSDASAVIAKMAGFKPIFVGVEGVQDPSLLKKAKVWIQPGGRARIQVQKMSSLLKEQIRTFVNNGGGYVGFCAGGFLATEHFGWVDTNPDNSFEADALGLLKGNSRYFDEYDSELNDFLMAKILPVKWEGANRQIYWELGPYFDSSTTSTAGYEVTAYYPPTPKGTKAMSVRGMFGKGKVYVTAVHPEAPADWRKYYRLNDQDGVDLDLAVRMVKWVDPSAKR